MTDREQTRRDADTIRVILRDAEYFDTEDGADQYVEAIAALDRILAELEQAERERVEASNAANRAWNVVLSAAQTTDPDVAEARLAKVPALVEALREISRGYPYPGIKAIDALTVWEQEQ